jgi:SAM-dependent methyltransferase
MIDIAERRIAANAQRARVIQSDGSLRFPIPDQSVDRVVSTYVLDLLSEADIRLAISEAHRVLTPDGMLCLASLTPGVTITSRLIGTLWSQLFRLHAAFWWGAADRFNWLRGLIGSIGQYATAMSWRFWGTNGSTDRLPNEHDRPWVQSGRAYAAGGSHSLRTQTDSSSRALSRASCDVRRCPWRIPTLPALAHQVQACERFDSGSWSRA